MNWLRDKLRRWLGFSELLRSNEIIRSRLIEIEQRLHNELLLPQNFHMRLTGTENSLRAVERRVEALGALPMGETTMMEAAQAEADAKILKDKERRDRSAAEARGMTLTEYYADVQRRREAKGIGASQ